MKASIRLIAVSAVAFACAALGKNADRPSRKPVRGCAWEKASDAAVGLEAWVQRCDFGFRKIDFLFQKNSLAIRYSDGGGNPDPLVDVLDLKQGETAEAGIRRLFNERTPRQIAGRCLLAPYRDGKPEADIQRYTFLPDREYQKELDRKADPNEVPEPPCGDWGTTPDGIQYFEVHPSSAVRRVLFVRVGQDEPLFDEKTLELVPPR
jgi:hypothetical protein